MAGNTTERIILDEGVGQCLACNGSSVSAVGFCMKTPSYGSWLGPSVRFRTETIATDTLLSYFELVQISLAYYHNPHITGTSFQ